MIVYEDRQDAGEGLADELINYKDNNPYIFALPRGGVPVAYQVSEKLKCPLDIITVRKLGVPWHPEFAFGAIAPDGVKVIHEDVVDRLNLTKEQIERVKSEEIEEMERRTKVYRKNLDYPNLAENTAIIIDDGIATGATMHAAVKFVKKLKPERTIIAVPVSAGDSADKLQEEVDDFICPSIPPNFSAVGQWYRKFTQTSDEQVIKLLKKSKNNLN
ncbi:phosphoribosyltransferase [Candidatus Dojkabacteria bacterium]|nr:phosphoribosyltransferase [Candidatus Dojkabacteria bacterium]